ncbi:MAG: hypothetical protein H6957_02840 [Chromatiaceae bacterium]|nr:hypothetical protein [Chromatiaceae bacterium]
MSTIELPLTRRMRFYAHALVMTATGLVLACPVAWSWRLVCAACVASIGLALWRRYLHRRPVSLQIDQDGGLRCRLANAQTWAVAGVRPGAIRPWLVSARLVGGPGQHCELFVPGTCLPESLHRQLRRALIGFRLESDAMPTK